MITKKMPLRSEDLVNQTALTLPEREMMDVITFAQTADVDTDQKADADADDVGNAAAQNANAVNICQQLAVALVNYSDYSEAEVEEAFDDCMQDAEAENDADQEAEEEDKKHK